MPLTKEEREAVHARLAEDGYFPTEVVNKLREQLVFAKATLEMASKGIADKQLLAVVRAAISKIET